MSARAMLTTFVAAAAATLLACGGEVGGGAPTATPAPKASVAATQAATAAPNAPVASATPAGTATALRTLGGVKFAERGTANVAGKTDLAVTVENFAFTPTFVQGAPGQKVTLQITNDTATPHNLSIKAQQVDRDVPAKSKGSVEVTIPQSGVLLFFCKFHTSSGMNGELLAGTGSPAAVDAPSAATPEAGGDAGYGY